MSGRITLFAVALFATVTMAGAESSVSSFTLVNAKTNEEVGELKEGAEIAIRDWSIVVRASEAPKSVRFQLEGPEQLLRVESSEPFSLGGDNDGNFNAVTIEPGSYKLTATPFSEPGAKGREGRTATISFVVKEGGAVEKFTVGDAKEVKLTKAAVTGELRQFQPVTITFEGPAVDEEAKPNPFRDYRLEVQFVHELEGVQIVVPGHFAADGNAAETSAKGGKLWRVHFTPELAGPWRFWTWFRQGENVVIGDFKIEVNDFKDPAGQFEIAPAAADGFLRHRKGERYLRYSGSDRIFIKGGADSPENFLAFADFDDTRDTGGADFIHRYEPHVRDWREGDPTWKNGKGKGIIGALNYLAGKGMNSVYFLTYNLDGGDGKDTWPWSSPEVRDRFDVSKLDQWNLVFDHMDRLGLSMHVVLQETENDQGLDGASLGAERRLYFRELISRFGHHHGVVWNLGEENTNTTAQQKAFCDFIRATDAYDHPIVVHTFPGRQEAVYKPLLGFPKLDGPSLQMGGSNAQTHAQTLHWIRESQKAGYAWFVCHDETGPADRGADPDERDDNNQTLLRRIVLWGNLMAGGAGVEWYFGYKNRQNDLNCEDWRSRDRLWDFTRHAIEFFGKLPVEKMESADELLVDPGKHDHVFSGAGIHVVYSAEGEPVKLKIDDAEGLSAKWFNPRTGEVTEAEFQAANGHVLLTPPTKGDDWAAQVTSK